MFLLANNVLSKVFEWSLCNSLQINVKISKAVVFVAKNKSVPCVDFKIASHSLDVVKEHKISGVIFSSRMM